MQPEDARTAAAECEAGERIFLEQLQFRGRKDLVCVFDRHSLRPEWRVMDRAFTGGAAVSENKAEKHRGDDCKWQNSRH